MTQETTRKCEECGCLHHVDTMASFAGLWVCSGCYEQLKGDDDEQDE